MAHLPPIPNFNQPMQPQLPNLPMNPGLPNPAAFADTADLANVPPLHNQVQGNYAPQIPVPPYHQQAAQPDLYPQQQQQFLPQAPQQFAPQPAQVPAMPQPALPQGYVGQPSSVPEFPTYAPPSQQEAPLQAPAVQQVPPSAPAEVAPAKKGRGRKKAEAATGETTGAVQSAVESGVANGGSERTFAVTLELTLAQIEQISNWLES